MKVSIVIPALDEAAALPATLGALQSLRQAGHEIIVVDGGSRDGTVSIATPLADRVLRAARGRAAQMNAGAAAATGDVLLFLHADSTLPDHAIGTLADAMRGSTRRWGRFDVSIVGASLWLPLVATLMNLRSRLSGIATGDQGIFVERALFDAVGGYHDQPLMEDIALSRALKRAAGRPLCLRARNVTSGRRWDAHGAWRTIVTMWRLRFANWRGIDPAALARDYLPHAKDPASMAPTLQIFAKAPLPGSVKTRLAAAIGPVRAAAVHRELVLRTLHTAVAARESGIVGRIELWCAPDADDPAFVAWRDRFGVTPMPQQGNDLGERMRYALTSSLSRGVPVILIGSDCPLLGTDYLANAAAALCDHDAVFGPAEDGGYVLVGMSRLVDAFTGIAWSTAGVMAATRVNLANAKATWRELATLWDVDLPADLARWEAMEPADERGGRYGIVTPSETMNPAVPNRMNSEQNRFTQ